MTARELDELWGRYLAGEDLTSAEAEALVQTMSRDPATRRTLLDEAQMDGLLRGVLDAGQGERFVAEWNARWKLDQAQDAFVAAVERRVRDQAAAPPAKPPALSPPRRRWGTGVALSAGALALAAALVLAWRSAEPPQDTRVSSELPAAARLPRAPAVMVDDPPPRGRAARIEVVRGDGHRLFEGSVTPAKVGDWLGAGDGVMTGGGASALALQLADGTRVRLSADTVLPDVNDGSDVSGLVVAEGRLAVEAATRPRGRLLRVVTRHATAVVTSAAFTLESASGKTQLRVARGEVTLQAGGRSTRVGAGEQAIVDQVRGLTVTRTPDRRALILVGTTSGAAGEADRLIRTRLEAMGFEVQLRDLASSSLSDLRDAAVVLVSASVRTGNAPTPAMVLQLRDAAVPIVTWEPRLYAALGMTVTADGETGIAPSTVEIVIHDPLHPLSAGLKGTVELFADGPDRLRWASPGPFAAWAATLVGEPTRAICFGYEKGVPMPGGTAPARRVGLGLKVTSPLHLSEAGWAVFQAAVTWAADAPSVARAAPP